VGASGKLLHYKGSTIHRIIKGFMLQVSRGSPAKLKYTLGCTLTTN